jgi:hypothetical protein
MPCAPSQFQPTYDDQFFKDIEKCPKSPQAKYCECYDAAALQSQIRRQQTVVDGNANAITQARDAYLKKRGLLYPKMSPADSPPLNVPSRADQKANTFSKVFDPKTRKIIVLLIAGFLLFLATIHAE